MLRILPIMALAVLGTGLQAQEHFQRAFGPLQTSGEYQVAGAIRHPNGEWTMRGGTSGANTLLRVGPDGQDVWSRELGSTQFSAFGGVNSIAVAPNNGAIVVRTDSIRILGADLSERSFDVIKMNSAGAVEWARQHTFTVPEELIVPSDGHAIAGAPGGNFYVYSGEPSRPILFRFAANGPLSWAKELVAVHPIGHVRSLTSDDAGNCILLADGSAAFGDSDRVVVMKISPTGTTQWSFIMQPFATGRSFLPAKAIARANGHTLISGMEYGNGAAAFGVLIDLDISGSLAWARRYAFDGDQSLTTYTADERNDGHLWLDFQEGGYGLAHLTATGEVVEAERFTYQVSGNSVGVVEWQRKLIDNDHLGLVGDYFIDQSWTSDDPNCDWLWDLDAMSPELCGTDPVSITSTPMAAQDIITAVGPTLQNISLSSGVITVTATATAPAPTASACAIILNTPEMGNTASVRISPTLLSAGEAVQVHGAPAGTATILDAAGRLLVSVPLNGNDRSTLPTDACAQGLHIVRVSDASGRPVGTARLMVQ